MEIVIGILIVMAIIYAFSLTSAKPAKNVDQGEDYVASATYAEAVETSPIDTAQPLQQPYEAKTKESAPVELSYSEPSEVPKQNNELSPPPKNIQEHFFGVRLEVRLDDESIIDVGSEGFAIPAPTPVPTPDVPTWPHQYVYSYQALDTATAAQKAFYKRYRESFLEGDSLDLAGNSNYAFVLLFDLLNESDRHTNLRILEEQLSRLGASYPKTASYANNFLLQKLKSRGDLEHANRLLLHTQARQNYYEDYYTPLGTRYKKNMRLSEDEVVCLNKVAHPGNNFCSIEFCLFETLKLYLALIRHLDEAYKLNGHSLEAEINSLAGLVATKHFRYKVGSTNYKFIVESTGGELHSLIVKHCENALRDYYGHKRKIKIEVSYPPIVVQQLEEGLFKKGLEALPVLVAQRPLPDESTEEELNIQNTTRWKIAFEKITENFSAEKITDFVTQIERLARLNSKNASVENIYFEASRFLSKWHKEGALRLYVHYLYHDLISATFDHKKLTKTIQKNLFQSDDQLRQFEQIVTDLIQHKDLTKALAAVPEIYAQKRKKIKLDAAAITEVHRKHSSTVGLLDEILADPAPSDTVTITPDLDHKEEMQIIIEHKDPQIPAKDYGNSLGLNPVQLDAIELFSKSNYTVTQADFDVFARSNNLFKSSLIESINSSCYEALDDVLIEEEDDIYTLNERYYQTLFSND